MRVGRRKLTIAPALSPIKSGKRLPFVASGSEGIDRRSGENRVEKVFDSS